jgi:hypothetical protein
MICTATGSPINLEHGGWFHWSRHTFAPPTPSADHLCPRGQPPASRGMAPGSANDLDETSAAIAAGNCPSSMPEWNVGQKGAFVHSVLKSATRGLLMRHAFAVMLVLTLSTGGAVAQGASGSGGTSSGGGSSAAQAGAASPRGTAAPGTSLPGQINSPASPAPGVANTPTDPNVDANPPGRNLPQRAPSISPPSPTVGTTNNPGQSYTSPPDRAQPGPAASTRPGAAQSANSDGYAECMAMWSAAATRMSREEWTRTCDNTRLPPRQP